MTVKQLIDKLMEYDPETTVRVAGIDHDEEDGVSYMDIIHMNISSTGKVIYLFGGKR